MHRKTVVASLGPTHQICMSFLICFRFCYIIFVHQFIEAVLFGVSGSGGGNGSGSGGGNGSGNGSASGSGGCHLLKKNLAMIWDYAKNFKLRFAILYFCIITTTFISAAYPYIFGRLVDEVFYGKNMAVFIQIVLLYGGLFLIGQLLHFTLNMTWAHLMTRFLFTVRKTLFDKTLSLNATFLHDMHTGDIIKRMRDDVGEFMNFIHWNVLYLSAGVIYLLISIGMIFYFNAYIGIVTVLITPIMTYLTRRFGKKAKSMFEKIRKEEGILQSWTYEILKGMREVVILAACRRAISRFMKSYIKIIRYAVETGKIEVMSERVGNGITLAARMIIYALCGYFVWCGGFTVGAFVSVIAYFGTAASSLTNLSQKWVDIQNNMTGVDRVRWLLEQESEECFDAPLNITRGDVEFDHVGFAYKSGNNVLRDVSLNAHSGEKVALVGKSGAGKSTMANLLLAFFRPDEGIIRIDGQDIGAVNLESLRRQIGIVWQDIMLFDGTLRQNLQVAKPGATDDEICGALRKANLLEFIESLPQRLDTLVGQSGAGEPGEQGGQGGKGVQGGQGGQSVQSGTGEQSEQSGQGMQGGQGGADEPGGQGEQGGQSGQSDLDEQEIRGKFNVRGLSGGQKQRLAIARIFLRDPKILIFDEATSSLDAENEQAIKDAWNELSTGRTMIIIAHRLSTIRDADKVAVLAEGRMVACDHHSKLSGNCAEYDELYSAQYI